ncbi:MAG: hypothetical protein BMS9Abin32_267 [Gammaproteobacteria bacterium]|nr:MAG: hypothetical protein BMS9Abin32_267 [Gammaproteobacteria bacterium]
MPSSTSSSDSARATPQYDRTLPPRSLGSSALIAVLTCLALLGGWEWYWRDAGVTPSYRNSEGLWAMQRRRIDNGEGGKTVFTGASRVFFDTQLDVWEAVSGERPIQLSLEGTSPIGVMEGLADDADFTGTLLVGVSPGSFFSGFEYRRAAMDRYLQETPSQWIGQQVSMPFEPYLRFYSFDYALFTVLKRQPWPEREGVKTYLDVRRLSDISSDRNARMFPKVEYDAAYSEIVRGIWAQRFKPIEERDEEWRAEALENRSKQIERAVAATKKLQERGVEVIFLRNPAEGHYAIAEPMYNPRAETWDVLLEKTGALGIHWQDHEELQGYWLPEWSHMSGSEADRYTKALYQVVQRERTLRVAESGQR